MNNGADRRTTDMGQNWKHHRGVAGVLAVAVVAIWGIVGYQVMTAVAPDRPGAPASSGNTSAAGLTAERRWARETSRDAYRPTFPDPFRSPLTSPSPASGDRETSGDPQPMSGDTEALLPPLARGWTLVGIVDETAILRHPDGAMHITRRGASIGLLRIRTVTDAFVVLARDRRVDTLRLRPPARSGSGSLTFGEQQHP